MFTKHKFQVKNCVRIKHSQRLFICLILLKKNIFSKTILPEFINICFNKQQLSKLKIQFTYGTSAIIFALDKEPMLFQIANISKNVLFPSGFLLKFRVK